MTTQVDNAAVKPGIGILGLILVVFVWGMVFAMYLVVPPTFRDFIIAMLVIDIWWELRQLRKTRAQAETIK